MDNMEEQQEVSLVIKEAKPQIDNIKPDFEFVVGKVLDVGKYRFRVKTIRKKDVVLRFLREIPQKSS